MGRLLQRPTSFGLLTTIEERFPDNSEICIDFLKHLSCLMQAPPCDLESDLLLTICEESCTAYDMLMSASTCDFLDEPGHFNGLNDLQSLYTSFECRNYSNRHGSNSCTNLFSAENQGTLTVVCLCRIILPQLYRQNSCWRLHKFSDIYVC